MRQRRLEQLVTPFYLSLMRLNAIESGTELLPSLLKAGRRTSPEEVVELLGDPWRSTVMGAWFALFHDEEAVAAAVLNALAASEGSLTSPPLATVAAVIANDRALAALEVYASNDAAQEWGACGFAAAVIEFLGGSPTDCVATPQDIDHFRRLLGFATELRAAP